MSEGLVLAERRTALAAATRALTDLQSIACQVQHADLGPLLRQVDDLGRLVEAARVAVVAEAMDRGELRADVVPVSDLDRGHGEDAGDSEFVVSGVVGAGWVAAWAPSLRPAGAVKLVRLCENLRVTTSPTMAAVHGGVVWDAVLAGRVSVANATVILSEVDRLTPRLQPEAVPTVARALTELACRFGPREIRAVRTRLVAEYGRDGELQGVQDAAHRRMGLSQPYNDGDGISEYRLRLDAEATATLEAALGPLSAPRPSEAGPDLRGSDRRRADALVDLVRRAVSCPEGAPLAAKAQLMVTMNLDDLTDQVKAGTTLGNPGGVTPLAAGTVRRLSCDAALIPALLGSGSRVLDLGRTVRLFTTAQVKALWLRDQTCSIPGCSMPAPWCDAHHLVHWADGGATDIANGALLCGYHHRWVHDRDLTGHLGPDGHVHWNLHPGSYTHALREQRDPRPPPPCGRVDQPGP